MNSRISRKDLLDSLGAPLMEAFKENQLTPSALAKKLKAELNARKTEAFCFRGKVVVSPTMVDWPTRQKARMDAHKLRGDYPAERHHLDGKFETDIPSAHVRELADRIKKGLLQNRDDQDFNCPKTG